MKKNNRFQRKVFGSGGVYVCNCCGKRTRETGEGESDLDLCRKCYVEAGEENGHSDGHHRNHFSRECPVCREVAKFKQSEEFLKMSPEDQFKSLVENGSAPYPGENVPMVVMDFKDQSAILAEMGLPTDPFLQGIMDHKIPEWAK